MSEKISYMWDFTSVPTFFDDWNDKFTLIGFGSDTYEFVFCDSASTNINDCLTNGKLNTTYTHIANNGNAKVDCTLQWNSAQKTISVRNDTVWNIGANTYPIKAVFLRKKDTGYVLGYCIHQNAFDVTNKVTIEKNSILWSIQNG